MKKEFLTILFCLFVFTLPAFAQTGEAVKFNEFAGNINCETYLQYMRHMINEGQKNPNSQIYVFVYEGRIQEYGTNKKLLPQYGLARAKIRSMKQYISNVRGLDIKRFEFVEAGLREDFAVEFWGVPAGVNPPSPTPTLKKIKYRKGKPKGFCLWCC